jgi:hypothetical protein
MRPVSFPGLLDLEGPRTGSNVLEVLQRERLRRALVDGLHQARDGWEYAAWEDVTADKVDLVPIAVEAGLGNRYDLEASQANVLLEDPIDRGEVRGQEVQPDGFNHLDADHAVERAVPGLRNEAIVEQVYCDGIGQASQCHAFFCQLLLLNTESQRLDQASFPAGGSASMRTGQALTTEPPRSLRSPIQSRSPRPCPRAECGPAL